MDEYHPTGPYEIKEGGQAGKFLELMMFREYGHLFSWLNDLNKWSHGGKNRLHRHLEWLLKSGEQLQASMPCPWCKSRPVRRFYVRRTLDGDFSVSPRFVSCNDPVCMRKLQGQPLDLCFSSIRVFSNKIDQRRIVRLFRVVFGLPKRLSPKAAFAFFSKSAPQAPPN